MKYACALLLAVTGCQFSDAPAPAVRTPSTNPAMLATTQPSYWYAREPSASVKSMDYERLWLACARAAKDYGFEIDREDYRSGVLTTKPMISKQIWEAWRRDAGTTTQAAAETIATHRRTIRFTIRKSDGAYVASPYVLVERYASAEQPIAADVYLRSALQTSKHPMLGTHETDRGIYLPRSYWYAVGRDEALERQIAEAVEKAE